MNVSALVLLAVLAQVIQQPENSRRIQDVQIRDNRRVRADAIKFKIASRPGEPINRALVARDVRAVYALGQFDDVWVEEEQGDQGPILVFHVSEKPLIRRVIYSGLKSVTESDVLKALSEGKATLQQQTAFDPGQISRATRVLTSLLQEKGRGHAMITTSTERVPPNSVILTIHVDEGPKVRIGGIQIEGNSVFTDAALKRAMKLTKEQGPLTSFSGKDTYHPGKLQSDLNDIRKLYAAHGYVRLNVLDPAVEERPKMVARTLPFIRPQFPWGLPLPFGKKKVDQVFLTLKLEENKQYRIGEINVVGSNVIPAEGIKQLLAMRPGDLFNEDALRKAFENLKALYGQVGYINFVATPEQTFEEEGRVVNLKIEVTEGKQYFVNRISFQGNTSTRDKVIRRQLFIDEGAVFNSKAWDISRLRLNQLGFFEEIKEEDMKLTTHANEPKVDISIQVKEHARNAVAFNGGTSSGGSFLGLSYETNNFIGLGESLSASAGFGTRQTQYQLSFTEPYLFDRPISTGFSLFSSRFRYDQAREVYGLDPNNLPADLGLQDRLNFEQESTGYAFSASYPVITWGRFGATFRSDTSGTSAINPATREFFSTLASQERQGGTVDVTGSLSGYRARRLTPSFSYSTVNSPYSPSGGYSATLGLEFVGGFLGGNVNFYRPTFELKAFKQSRNSRNVLAMRFLTSYIQGFTNTATPFYERSFIGGDYNIRGFENGSVSPMAYVTRTFEVFDTQRFIFRDVAYDDVTYVGGDTQAVFNLEYRVPLAGPFTLAPFLDIGNSWVFKDTSLRRYTADADGNVRREDVRFVPGTNSGVRSSAGVELQFVMPMINQPFRIMLGVNPTRISRNYQGPVAGTPFTIREPATFLKFSVGKTF
jgi:outer membrane protein insertion porin family